MLLYNRRRQSRCHRAGPFAAPARQILHNSRARTYDVKLLYIIIIIIIIMVRTAACVVEKCCTAEGACRYYIIYKNWIQSTAARRGPTRKYNNCNIRHKYFRRQRRRS